MTREPDRFEVVVALIERYLSGQLSFDAAADALKPILQGVAEQQERLWRQYGRRPGDPIRLKEPSAEQWRDPNVARGDVITPMRFAPSRSQEDEQRARTLFEEAFRRAFRPPVR
jgi:hypothetical protein